MLAHPRPGVHVSVVHDLPSLQSRVVPPPEHWPETQVPAKVKTRPEQVPPPHGAPSSIVVHADALVAVAHTWQAFEGFGWPSP